MRRQWVLLGSGTVVAFVLLIAYRVHSQYAAFADAPPPAVQAVAVTPARIGRLVETLNLNGNVIFPTEVKLNPKAAGILRTLYVDEGKTVKQGDILAVIDHTEVDAQLAQAQAAVRAAQASLNLAVEGAQREQIQQAQAALTQAEANLTQAQNDYRRFKELFDMQAITRQQYEIAANRLQNAQQGVAAARAALRQLQIGTRPAQLDALRAQVQGALATVRLIQAQVDNYTVRAPVAGRVTQKLADVGALVSPSVALLSLAQAGRPQVELTVPETEVGQLRLGQHARVTAPALGTQVLTGHLATISPIVDPQAHLVKGKIYLDASPGLEKLRGGMQMDVALELASLPQALLVPSTALLLDSQGHASVFLVGVDQRAREQAVKILARQPEQAAVTGIQAGDRVIVAGGGAFVKAGDLVNVQPMVADAAPGE